MNEHQPVMPQKALELLRLPRGGVAVDGTLGLAGHALLMATVLGPGGHLIGIDRDNASLRQAERKLASLGLKIDCPLHEVAHQRGMEADVRGNYASIHLFQGTFSTLDKILAGLKVSAVDGILLDLGVSSFQLGDASRGFSFKSEGPLDMRMDSSHQGISAADLVNGLKESQLEKIILEFGEDRFARRIAAAIVRDRAKAKIKTTKTLADIILRALPKSYARGRLHPATRTFQALRIAVNEELEELSLGLDVCFRMLKKGGRLCVISFHSLEDRLVKNKFKSLSLEGEGSILTKRPLTASDHQRAENPRSRSAKMRAIERVK